MTIIEMRMNPRFEIGDIIANTSFFLVLDRDEAGMRAESAPAYSGVELEQIGYEYHMREPRKLLFAHAVEYWLVGCYDSADISNIEQHQA